MLLTTATLSALSERKRGEYRSTAGYIDSGILNERGDTDTSLYDPHGAAPRSNLLYNIAGSPSMRIVKLTVASVFAFFLMFSAAFTVGGNFYGADFLVASADDEDTTYDEEASSIFRSALSGVSSDDFEDGAEMSSSPPEDAEDGNWVPYIFYRLLGTYYLNTTADAYDPGQGISDLRNTPDGICLEGRNASHAYGPNQNFRGTPLYHNCDIPNIMTEAMQDMVSLVDSTGVRGANMVSAHENWGIGLPHEDVLPAGNVPVSESDRSSKYTALEVYGYNLNYTYYSGEWDHIKVMSDARMMSNYGMMDGLMVGLATVWDSLLASMEGAADGISQGWEEGGNVLTSTWGAFRGGITGAVSAYAEMMVRSVLDTADYNVFNQHAWYRVNYPDTIYGARQLSQQEMANYQATQRQASMIRAFMRFMEQNAPETAELPEEFMALAPENIPPEPNIDGDPTDEEIEGFWDDWRNLSFFDNLEEGDVNNSMAPCLDKFITADEDYDYDAFVECWEASHSGAFESVYSDLVDDLSQRQQEKLIEQIEAAMREEERPAGHPAARFICVDGDGEDITTQSATDYVWVYQDIDRAAVDPLCNISSLRPPIQDGLFGNGYLTREPMEDTRRAQYGSVENFISNGIVQLGNFVSNQVFTATTSLAKVSNLLVEASFSPIFQTLGVDRIAVSLIESYRDSMFFPLSVLLVGWAGIAILWKVVFTRSYRQGWFNILMVVLVFVSGVIMMSDPKRLVQLSDDVPSAIENGLAAGVYSLGNEDADAVCTATGTRDSDDYDSFEGFGGDSFETSAVMRTMMCEVWRTFAFAPWVYGQFGSPYTDLYASGYSDVQNGRGEFENTNDSLVGDAQVHLGGPQGRVNNWALYQLESTVSGTTTTQDTVESVGHVNTDMYRLVDLQAGPDNSHDPQHFDFWSGDNIMDRVGTSLMSILTSIAGLAAIFLFVILKLEYTLMMTVMLVFMPLMFLMGMEPTNGRGLLKKYLGTLVSLIVKRVMVVVMLALMLRLLASVGADGGASYYSVALLTILICIVFIVLRRKIMDMINQSANKVAGGDLFGASGKSDAFGALAPKSVKQGGMAARRAAIGVAGGAIGGGLSAFRGNDSYAHFRRDGRSRWGSAASAVGSNFKHGVTGAFKGAQSSARIEGEQSMRRIRRKGYGLGMSLYDTGRAIDNEMIREVKGSDNKYADSLRFFAIRSAEQEKSQINQLASAKGWTDADGNITSGSLEAKGMQERLKGLDGKIDKAKHGNVVSSDFDYLFEGKSDREKRHLIAAVKKRYNDLKHGGERMNIPLDERLSGVEYDKLSRAFEEYAQRKRRNAERAEMAQWAEDDAYFDPQGYPHIKYQHREQDIDTDPSVQVYQLINGTVDKEEGLEQGYYRKRGFATTALDQARQPSGDYKFNVVDRSTGVNAQFDYQDSEGEWNVYAVDNDGDLLYSKTVESSDLNTVIPEVDNVFLEEAQRAHADDHETLDLVDDKESKTREQLDDEVLENLRENTVQQLDALNDTEKARVESYMDGRALGKSATGEDVRELRRAGIIDGKEARQRQNEIEKEKTKREWRENRPEIFDAAEGHMQDRNARKLRKQVERRQEYRQKEADKQQKFREESEREELRRIGEDPDE